MKFKKANGRETNVNISKYTVDWEDDSLSKFQWKVKQFLYKYWRSHVVLEEMTLAGTRMRLDFYNVTRGIAVECDGGQHNDPKHYYNNKSPSKFISQVKRDLEKEKWCELNGIKLIRIMENEIDNLSEDWIREKYDITL
jgi:hypothetical protein